MRAAERIVDFIVGFVCGGMAMLLTGAAFFMQWRKEEKVFQNWHIEYEDMREPMAFSEEDWV